MVITVTPESNYHEKIFFQLKKVLSELSSFSPKLTALRNSVRNLETVLRNSVSELPDLWQTTTGLSG